MEGIKLNNASVLEDLNGVKPYIDNMVKSLEKLSDAQELYLQQFKDDISEKSSKIIQNITNEIENLKNEIKKIVNNVIVPLEELEEWRSW